MKKQRLFLFFVLLVAAALVAACGSPAAAPTEVPAVEEPTSAPVGDDTQPEATAVVDTSGDAPTAEPEVETGGVPADIPLIEGYRDLQISPDSTNMSYIIDGMTIADVVAYYQVELEAVGWEMGRAPDNALPNMGTMGRVNAQGDRVSFSLQNNPVGGFVVIRITISRSGK